VAERCGQAGVGTQKRTQRISSIKEYLGVRVMSFYMRAIYYTGLGVGKDDKGSDTVTDISVGKLEKFVRRKRSSEISDMAENKHYILLKISLLVFAIR
jgi:hypothetical protein